MGAVRGALVGSAGLVTLYNLTATKDAAGVSTLFGLPGRLAHWLISPDVPLIPDLRTGAAKTAPDGSVTGTNSQGDTVTQKPNGQTTIGGPNGIPVYPNSYATPAANAQLISLLGSLNPSTTPTVA